MHLKVPELMDTCLYYAVEHLCSNCGVDILAFSLTFHLIKKFDIVEAYILLVALNSWWNQVFFSSSLSYDVRFGIFLHLSILTWLDSSPQISL